MSKSKKFKVSDEQYEKITKDIKLVELRSNTRFNFSLFCRLCTDKVTDVAFLTQIGYYSENKTKDEKFDLLFPKAGI